VASAFHCARRLRVFARDILRLGTAMIELSIVSGGIWVALPASLDYERRQLLTRIAGELDRLQTHPAEVGL